MPRKILTRYTIPAFLLPVLFPVVLVLLIGAVRKLLDLRSDIIPVALFFLVPALSGWLWAAKSRLPDTLFARLFPLLLPLLLLPLAYIPGALNDRPLIPGSILSIILFIAGIAYICFYLVFVIRSEWRRRSTERLRGAARLLGCGLVSLGLAAALHAVAMRDIVAPGAEASVGHGMDVREYHPFSEDNLLVKPASPASLRISADYPRLDGATAAFPLYAAFAQAVYAGLDVQSAHELVNCYTTLGGYDNLVENRADIFFGFAPSREQRDYAISQGLTFTETPIAREAFVFFTHKDNPVRSLTREQIRGIYSGSIRNWKDVGGADEKILAFQRPVNSGSQSAMLRIMAGSPLRKPLRREYAAGMGDIILRVAEYSNRKNAIGYSFRWYATTLFTSPDIRLLAIDGIEPTPENIRNNTYPFTDPLLAVTARPPGAESKRLLDWILGPEGQDLVKRVGYVPLR